MSRARTKPTADVIDLNAMGRDVATSELPATMPILLESNAQIVQWQREIANALDERGLIDEQIASANRIRKWAENEASITYDAKCKAALKAMNREVADAEKLEAATVEGLRRRQENLGAIISGLQAAVSETTKLAAE
jgi:predicted TIM-barrel enzyme